METGRNTKIHEKAIVWSLCAALFFTPFSISLTSIFAFLSFGLTVFSPKYIRNWREFLRSKWFYPVITLIALAWLGLLYSQDIELGLKLAGKTNYWLLAFSAALIAYRGVDTKIVFKAYIAGLALSAIISILHYLEIIVSSRGHIGFINTITYSLLLAFGLLLLSFYFKHAQGLNARAGIAALSVLLLITLVLVPGRIGHLSFVLLSPIIAFNYLGRHFKKALILLAALPVILAASPVVRENVSEAFSDISQYGQGNLGSFGDNSSSSIGLRFHMWKGAANIFMESPVIGAGTGSYRLLMKKYEDPSVKGMEFHQPHNTFMYMASNYGVIGIGAILWFFFVFIKRGWEERRIIQGAAFLYFILIILVGSLTDTQLIQGQSGMMLAIFTGLSERALNNCEER